jgi:hypothetical protein
MTCFGNGQQLPSCNYGFYTWRNANLAVPSGVEVLVGFLLTSATDNPLNFYSTVGNIATVPVTGRYVMTTGVEIVTAAAGSAFLRLYINGVYAGASSDEASTATTLTPNFALTKYLFAGDTVRPTVFQNTGFAATLIGCCNQLFFSMSACCVV